MPIHVINVVRNPYDNTAIMLLYNEQQKFSVTETHKYEDEEGLDNQINSYFHQVRSVVEMIDELKLQVTEVHSKEFIANPKATPRRLCLTLHIDCSGEYLHTGESPIPIYQGRALVFLFSFCIKFVPYLKCLFK